MKDITVQELVNMDHAVLVDVRSPFEFSEAHIPGAINVPIFTNEERQEVGTLYKQADANTAKWRAMEIVSPKLPAILAEIKNITQNDKLPILYCARGGMRSGSIATFVEFSGLPSFRLAGGYRAYRQYIVEMIPKLIPEQAIVLHGMTGTGKTEILHNLKHKGYPVIDLEGIAAHRGSLFGTVGYQHEGHNQKVFDSLLYESLREIQGSPYFIVEAESKRIGKAGQSDELYESKLNGINIYITSSIETRVERIMKEYVEPNIQAEWFDEDILRKVLKMEKRFKNKDAYQLLLQEIENKSYPEVIRLLLNDYYDPRYGFKIREYKNSFITIDGNDIDDAVKEIEEYIAKLPFSKKELTPN
ncbi:tRNA 2-selenouridine(34) synthase MnmH [Niallia sp. Krafla_26]|uniref:tRNA 2-selenouridine(34) synthase MnmH n=1 Tax=Niallia sp. Krafla_26 TaxID=3064703 RepID=UPI003D1793ED